MKTATESESQQRHARRTAILICGMHRCGTSALARVLNLVGAELPLNLYPPGMGNEQGHWEPRTAPALHDEILGAMGTSVNALWPGDEDWMESAARKPFKSRIEELIAAEYGDRPLIVVKDPRISLVLPLWIETLSENDFECRIIVCFRNPLETAQSFSKRQAVRLPHEAWEKDRGGLLWLRYVVAAERYSRGSKRAFCDYSDLLTDWRSTVRRIGTQIGVAWPAWTLESESAVRDFLKPEHRHHVADASLSSLGQAWQEWIDPIYGALQRAASGAALDEETFDRIGAAFRDTMRYFNGYFEAIARHQLQEFREFAIARQARDAETNLLRARVAQLEAELARDR